MKSERFAAITDPGGIGELLRAVDGYTGHFATQGALRLSPLVLLRPREGKWAAIDTAGTQWCIPAAKVEDAG